MFDAGKTRMIWLPYGEKNYDNMLSHYHLIPEGHGQTDRIAISISRVSVLTRDKNCFVVLVCKSGMLFQCKSVLNCGTGILYVLLARRFYGYAAEMAGSVCLNL